MTENCSDQPAVAGDLANWQAELDFEAVLMTDPGRDIWTAFAEANDCELGGGVGGPGCSNAVTVLIDREMRIRHFGTTYACGAGEGSNCGESAMISSETAECLQGALDEIVALVDE